MKKIISLIFSAILLVGSSLGQGKFTEIYGVVSDSAGKPIKDLTVFIPFTSKGTTTNENGEYLLERIPAGEIELVFRHISFLPLTKTLSSNSEQAVELNVSMKNNILEIKEIVKRANPENWKFGYERFKEHVLGDPIGRYCEVKNPSDIYFHYDGERLTGHATEPLEIVNNYLGYKLVYFLDYFWYSKDITNPDGSIQQASFAFSGSAFYVDRIDEKVLRKMTWERNRMTEFNGTLKHFLLSVYYDQLVQQEFEIKQAWKNLQNLQKSENISPSMAYVRSMLMEKRFYWDKSSNKSIYLHYNPEEDYPIQSKTTDLNQVPPTKSIRMDDELLVLYFWNPRHQTDEARVAYMEIVPDESGAKPQLEIDDQGNYTAIGGELIWNYLDTQTKLVTALPADYEEKWVLK